MVKLASQKSLVIVMNQLRDFDVFFNNFRINLLSPLRADLAYCGETLSESNSMKYEITYDWSSSEPLDWTVALDAMQKDSHCNWRELIPFGNLNESHFLGPTLGDASTGSGAINLYWKKRLQTVLSDEVVESYEWFILTRSDFNWIVKHPNIEDLEPESIYLQFGESYEGINDRHWIIHKKFIRTVLSIPDLIFEHTSQTRKEFEELGIMDLNPERFFNYSFEKLGLKKCMVEIPYLGFLVRKPNSITRWESGDFNHDFGIYIKYPREFQMSKETLLLQENGLLEWPRLLRDLKRVKKDLSSACLRPYEILSIKKVREKRFRRFFKKSE